MKEGILLKYKATKSNFRPTIEAVEIAKETESCVWIGNSRRAKVAEFEVYCDSFAEAKAVLVAHYEQKAIGVRRLLQCANSLLGNAKGLKDFTQGIETQLGKGK